MFQYFNKNLCIDFIEQCQRNTLNKELTEQGNWFAKLVHYQLSADQGPLSKRRILFIQVAKDPIFCVLFITTPTLATLVRDAFM